MMMSVFHVSDMHCISCQSRIEQALALMPGIVKVRANPVRRELFVDHDEDKVAALEVFTCLEQLGFTPLLGSEAVQHDLHTDIKRLGIAGLCMMQVVMQALALYFGAYYSMASEYVVLLQFTSFVFCLPVMFYSAQPFFSNAYMSLKSVQKTKDLLTNLSMDVPIALALIVAFSASTFTLFRGHGEVYFDSVVMFTFLLLGARFIDKSISSRRRRGGALSLLPKTCTKVTEAGDEVIAQRDVKIGDILLVRPGDHVMADGIILEGSACIDESLLTGESDPVIRKAGEAVIAGTSNYHQPFTFRVTKVGADLRLAQIEKVATQALLERPKIVGQANRVASYFVAALLLVALSTCIYWMLAEPSKALAATIAVLVVSCPCALALATPAAITAALSRLQSRGVLVRNGQVLEVAAGLKGIAFDKTGTLTTGNLQISHVELQGDLTEEQCLRIAAGLERMSQHPIAKAFHHLSPYKIINANVGSTGVSGNCHFGTCRIGTLAFCTVENLTASSDTVGRSIWLSIDHSLVARFELQEQWRQDIAPIIQSLKQQNVVSLLLSGDNAANCENLGTLMSVESSLSPENKRQRLAVFRQRVGPVLMLGDGINDLPALAGADLSAVVLESPEAVKSTADILLLSRQLQPINELIKVARRTQLTIRQNMAWAVIYNVIMIPLAVSAILQPWMAALGMSISSLIVVTNSARLYGKLF